MTRAPRSDAVRNRQRLIETATEAFATGGTGVPLESIAARAGVSIGTLYNHFSDRDGLVEAVLGDALDQLTAVADAAAERDDPWAAFEALVLGTCELQARDRAVADILGRRYPPPTGAIHAACAHLMDRFVEIIERGKRAGVLRDDLVVDDIGPIMWANARIVEASGTPDAWRRHLGFVLDGLRTPDAPPQR